MSPRQEAVKSVRIRREQAFYRVGLLKSGVGTTLLIGVGVAAIDAFKTHQSLEAVLTKEGRLDRCDHRRQSNVWKLEGSQVPLLALSGA